MILTAGGAQDRVSTKLGHNLHRIPNYDQFKLFLFNLGFKKQCMQLTSYWWPKHMNGFTLLPQESSERLSGEPAGAIKTS